MAGRHARPGLGLRVTNADGGHGVYVGGVREGTPGARAGLQEGDIVQELSGVPINSVDDLERVAAAWSHERPTSLAYRRGEERKSAILYP